MAITIAFIAAVLILLTAVGIQRWRKARRIERMRRREIERNTPRRLRRKMGA